MSIELEKPIQEEPAEKSLENRIALVITAFAAILAINGLFGGKYGDDEMIAHQKQTQAYTWYQSKGQKKMLAENKKDILEIFKKSTNSNTAYYKYLDSLSDETSKDTARYKLEMDEIRKGSARVGEKNWAQDIKGKLGQVIGAEEYEAEADKLGRAGDFFDYGDLALNLSLVLGAVSLILSIRKQKIIYLTITICLGTAGTLLTFYALYVAMM